MISMCHAVPCYETLLAALDHFVKQAVVGLEIGSTEVSSNAKIADEGKKGVQVRDMADIELSRRLRDCPIINMPGPQPLENQLLI